MNGALALAGVLAVTSPSQAEDAARDVLAQDHYRFCHDPRYPLTTDEHAWCPILETKSNACPALLEACKAPPFVGSDEERRAVARDGAGREKGEKGATDDANEALGDASKADREAEKARREREEQRIRERDERRVSLPVVGGLARILFFVLVGALVIAVARAIWKNVLEGRDKEDDKAPEKPAPIEAPSLGVEARGPVETDVARLLARARAAAARGEYTKAIDDAYAALLRRLDGDGLIDIHPSRTNGDYVRAVRERPELSSAMREILTDVERAQFGSSPPSEASFRAVFDRVSRLVTRAAAVLFVVFGLSATLSCDNARAGSASLSGGTSPSGSKALVELLRKSGFTVQYRSRGEGVLDSTGTLVLLPGAEIDSAEWSRIHEWVSQGKGSVLVVGASLPESAALPRSVNDATGERELSVGEGFASRIGVASVVAPVDRAIEARAFWDGNVVLSRGERAYAVRESIFFGVGGAGQFFVFADDRLFTNIALTIPENAAFVAGLMDLVPPNVEIIDAWSSAGADTPFESVANAKLLPVILQLLALVTLFLLWKGRAFADLRDPPARSRRSFADHARALGLAYARARASRHALGVYASWALERLRERVHRSGRRGLHPLAEAIAARTGRREGDVMRVLVEATGAREEAAPASFRSSQRGDGSGPLSTRSAARAEVTHDLALMRELEGFLAAVGVSSGRHRRRRRHDRAPEGGVEKQKKP